MIIQNGVKVSIRNNYVIVFSYFFVKAHFVYDLGGVLGLGYLQISLTHLIFLEI